METVKQYQVTDYLIYTHHNRETRKACKNAVRLSTLEAYETRERQVTADLVRAQSKLELSFDEARKYCAQGFGPQLEWPTLLCECGKLLHGERVLGRYTGTITVCNAKCTGATGQQCDCPCKGENHGGRHGGKLATKA